MIKYFIFTLTVFFSFYLLPFPYLFFFFCLFHLFPSFLSFICLLSPTFITLLIFPLIHLSSCLNPVFFFLSCLSFPFTLFLVFPSPFTLYSKILYTPHLDSGSICILNVIPFPNLAFRRERSISNFNVRIYYDHNIIFFKNINQMSPYDIIKSL
jgi:hypothetical protein